MSLSEKTSTDKPIWGPVQLIGVAFSFFFFFFQQDIVLKFTAAVFIPYYVWLVLVAVPIVVVQVRLGGSVHAGIVGIFSKNIPFLKGIGISVLIKLFILSLSLSVQAAYAFFYAFESLRQPYVFASCDNAWNTPCCSHVLKKSDAALGNISGYGDCKRMTTVFPEQEYFTHRFLQASAGIEDTGVVVWQVAVCLLGAWALIFLITCGGKRAYGWIACIMTIPAVIIWLGLIAYGREELIHNQPEKPFYTADFTQLTRVFDNSANITAPRSSFNKPQLNSAWIRGLMAVMTSLPLWYGILPTVGKCVNVKFCKKTGPALTVFIVLLVAVVGPHLVINLLAPYMGALSVYLNVPLQHLPGIGRHHSRLLSFVAFPMAFNNLSMKRGIAFVFYFSELLLLCAFIGLVVITVVDNCVDGLPDGIRRSVRKRTCWMSVAAMLYCVAAFLLSLLHATQAGYYWTTFIDDWLDVVQFIVIVLLLICFLVSLAKQPFGKGEKVLFGIWFFLASFGCAFVEIYTKVDFLYKKITELESSITLLRQSYAFPAWIFAIGWLLAGAPILIGLLVGLFHSFKPSAGCRHYCCGSGGHYESDDKTPISEDDHSVGYDGPENS